MYEWNMDALQEEKQKKTKKIILQRMQAKNCSFICSRMQLGHNDKNGWWQLYCDT